MTKLYIHPLQVRIWHWINAICVLALVLTGLQIRYVGLFDIMSLQLAITVHNWIGFILLGNFFIWLSFYLFSDKIKIYHPELNPKKFYRESFGQAGYYGWGIYRGAKNPHHMTPYNKFNALQKSLYQIIMLLVIPVQIITGILLWDVERFSGIVGLLGGVRVVDTVHVLILIFFSGFLFIHVYLATLGHTATAHIKAMFTGYEEIEEEDPKDSKEDKHDDKVIRMSTSESPSPLQIH
ncbi:MAG: cytochrome b/b6 domain-containing protein [Gammaproteobacteria bacterium]|nr:cytochrome b/b6 domain-containing protein [Gammaproteobacteria bacterium]MDH3464740.1 cytochrome b/b6 domain-containing protein [Gammaproteobacteria bacterium]